MWNKIKKNKIITTLIAAAIAAAISYGTTGSVNPITVIQAIQGAKQMTQVDPGTPTAEAK
jgi:hypothetical protein